MYEYCYFRNHLCITFELLSINLYEFIKNNKFQGLSLGLIRRFAIQILQALNYMYKERIIHCDLKPENILLRAPNKSGIKVIDFGSSCFEDERIYTYIQSRFYRSPEVILGVSYGRPIDMWSFGCILAELYTGYPLFPGENEVEQLNCIMELFGLPPKKLLDQSTRRKQFFDSNGSPRIVQNKRGKKRKPGSRDLVSSLNCNDKNFLNFLEGCLRWDPTERFTPEECLRHDWILEGIISPSLRSMPNFPSQLSTYHQQQQQPQVHMVAAGANNASSEDQYTDYSKAPLSSRGGPKTTTAAATNNTSVTSASSNKRRFAAQPILPPILIDANNSSAAATKNSARKKEPSSYASSMTYAASLAPPYK